MKLDGSPVKAGDLLHHMSLGQVSVTSVDEATATVKAFSGQTFIVDSAGRVNGRELVFWHDPVVIRPPKDDAAFRALLPIFSQLHAMVKS